jgi:hypothetical protein
VAEVPSLDQLATEFAEDDSKFFYVYVREAHPGENVPPHQSYEEKVERAREFRESEGLQNDLLVDGFQGPVHVAYGAGPNMACIIHKDGTLVYRSQWTDVEDLREQCLHLRKWDAWKQAGSRFRTSHIEKVRAWFEDEGTHAVRVRTYERAGQQAVQDFIARTGRSPI